MNIENDMKNLRRESYRIKILMVGNIRKLVEDFNITDADIVDIINKPLHSVTTDELHVMYMTALRIRDKHGK